VTCQQTGCPKVYASPLAMTDSVCPPKKMFGQPAQESSLTNGSIDEQRKRSRQEESSCDFNNLFEESRACGSTLQMRIPSLINRITSVTLARRKQTGLQDTAFIFSCQSDLSDAMNVV
jgi:hypothetical protein